jgi:hypothetical protein
MQENRNDFDFIVGENHSHCQWFVPALPVVMHQLNFALFSASLVRSVQEISPPPRTLNPRLSKLEIECIPNSSSPLEGIILYLTRKHAGTIHDLGIIKITSSGPYSDSPSYAAKNAADLTLDSEFWSENSPNQWLWYDFGDRHTKLTDHSIRSRGNDNPDDLYPKSWVTEISKDYSNWEEIDRRENDSSLKGRNQTRLFKVSRPAECRLIRLRQIGKNHFSSSSCNECLVISGFEVFGELECESGLE